MATRSLQEKNVYTAQNTNQMRKRNSEGHGFVRLRNMVPEIGFLRFLIGIGYLFALAVIGALGVFYNAVMISVTLIFFLTAGFLIYFLNSIRGTK